MLKVSLLGDHLVTWTIWYKDGKFQFSELGHRTFLDTEDPFHAFGYS